MFKSIICRFIVIKGNGSELFVRSVKHELDIQQIKKIIGDEAHIKNFSFNNYCFIVFKDQTEAAAAIDSLKQHNYIARFATSKRELRN